MRLCVRPCILYWTEHFNQRNGGIFFSIFLNFTWIQFFSHESTTVCSSPMSQIPCIMHGCPNDSATYHNNQCSQSLLLFSFAFIGTQIDSLFLFDMISKIEFNVSVQSGRKPGTSLGENKGCNFKSIFPGLSLIHCFPFHPLVPVVI